MSLQNKLHLGLTLPLLLTCVYLAAPGTFLHNANAQCPRPGFKLNYGYFSASANRVATADFNADGKMDFAASFPSGKLGVYFGDGLGEFSPPVMIPAQSSLRELFAADINNDAKPDLILNYDSGGPGRMTSVLINNGSGGFGAPVNNAFNLILSTMRVADLNGDGKADLIYLIGGLSVRLGDGTGNFPSVTSYAVTGAGRLVVGDFNGDGKQDVAVARVDNGANKVVLYLNDGSGGLVPGMETVLAASSFVQLAIDLNSDGKADIAGASFSGSPAVMVLLNNGSGGFDRTDYPISMNLDGVGAADLNGDGKIDLVTGGSVFIDRSTTLYGNGLGSFTVGESSASAYGWTEQGALADINGDGKTDIITGAGNGVRAFLRTCNNNANSKVADYDGDGLTDFAVWRPSTGEWIIDKTLSATRHIYKWGAGGLGDIPIPGDYDGDRASDLAVFRAPTGIWYALKSSDNTLFAVAWGINGDKPVPGDYDADGRTDVAVFRPSNGDWYILKSSDNAVSAVAFGTNEDKPVQADFDNDDKTDIAVYRPSTGHWYILKSSDSNIRVVHFGITRDKPAPADYDGDGKADIVVLRQGVAFYFLNSWNNIATGEADERFAGTFSIADLPAAIRRGDRFTPYIRRPDNNFFGGLGSATSGEIGMSGDIPVVAPYVLE